jgi:hypothetical protein
MVTRWLEVEACGRIAGGEYVIAARTLAVNIA